MLEEIAPNLFVQRHPLIMVGCQMGRVVTVIRLASGRLVIHSTANFSPEDVQEILKLGEPAWLVEATCFHDTCTKGGRIAFPDLPYLVPEGFKATGSLETQPILPSPDEWQRELDVHEIGGMPKIREHAFYHRPSKTLIVADLFFNLPPNVSRWTRVFLRTTGGIREFPGMSRLFRFMIKDREAFLRSIKTILEWDFERIVVAHGDPIEEDAKGQLLKLLTKHGLVPE